MTVGYFNNPRLPTSGSPAPGWERVLRGVAHTPCGGGAPGRGEVTELASRRWQQSTSRTPRCCWWVSSAWRRPWRSGTCTSALLCAWSSWPEPSRACKSHWGVQPAPRGLRGRFHFRLFFYLWGRNGTPGPCGAHLPRQ